MANCIDETQVEIMLSNIGGICGCSPCDEAVINNIIPTAVGLSTIYYGRNAATSLTDVQILAMASISQSNFAGIYSFGAGVGTYCWVAYPVLLGLPSSIKDPSTGFDFDMQLPVIVSVLGENYYVFRSTYQLGGVISAQFNQ